MLTSLISTALVGSRGNKVVQSEQLSLVLDVTAESERSLVAAADRSGTPAFGGLCRRPLPLTPFVGAAEVYAGGGGSSRSEEGGVHDIWPFAVFR